MTQDSHTNPSNGNSLQKFQNYFFVIPAVSTVIAIVAIALWGLHVGIDLKGGSLLQVTYPDGRPEQALLQEKVDALSYGEIRIQPSNENGYILRERELTQQDERMPAILC